MNSTHLELIGLGFWLALAVIVVVITWAAVKKQQMKHELTLKLLEKGQSIDTELLAKLIAPDSVRSLKSPAEQHREGGGVIGFFFVVLGLTFMAFAVVHQAGMSWPLLGLGAFSVLLGLWIWHGTMKEYFARQEIEKDSSRN